MTLTLSASNLFSDTAKFSVDSGTIFLHQMIEMDTVAYTFQCPHKLHSIRLGIREPLGNGMCGINYATSFLACVTRTSIKLY